MRARRRWWLLTWPGHQRGDGDGFAGEQDPGRLAGSVAVDVGVLGERADPLAELRAIGTREVELASR